MRTWGESEPSREIHVPMQRGRSLLIAAGAVLATFYASLVINNAKADNKEYEREQREYEVDIAASNFLDVISVNEQSTDGDRVTAHIVYGGEALKACRVTYEINQNDYRTFEPDSLDLSACFNE